jgi:hypothetical protein
MSEQPAICTLFEGHYHYGVAALVNSLYKQGFRGDIYAGYRGTLPAWACSTATDEVIDWPGAQSVQITDELRLHFLPLDTDYHFTNFKPDFMLMLWEGVAQKAEQLFYFDPDIVLLAPWSFFTQWATCGVALCEDVNSPLAEFHPRRVAWRRYFSTKSIQLHFRNAIYVNGGFVGVEDKAFLNLWKQVQEAMAPQIGGLSRSSLTDMPSMAVDQGPLNPFGKTDQDALNAAVEAWHGDVSFLGKEAMAFESGTILMPHALGQPKPWQWPYLKQAMQGKPPRVVDRAYWDSANEVLQSQPDTIVLLKKFTISIAAFIGRFYRRGTI